MKTKTFWLISFCVLFPGFSLAQSTQEERGAGKAKPWVLPSDISVPKAPRRALMNVNTSISSCNNNGICEPWLGDSCTSCADCIGNAQCAQLADVCTWYNFVGGKPGPVYDQCLDGTYIYLYYGLRYLAEKYAAPGSNIVNEPGTPFTQGDGKCNQTLDASIEGGSCGGFPRESCANDPQDCGPCPTVENITDSNIDLGSCDPAQCAQGVCTVGQCSTTTACQFNCGSAHYGGSSPIPNTHQSDAVDFSVSPNDCSAIATLGNSICPPGGANFVSYSLETPGTLHVSANTLTGSFPSVPDSTGATPVACPSASGGPPSFRAWLGGAAINNVLFAVGGGTCNTCAGFGGNELPTTEVYDSANGAWYSKGMLQTARFGLATSVVNGKIYALGGTNRNQSQPEPSLEEYDPGTDAWTSKSTMPTPRWKLTASGVNGIIYAIGGGASGNQCVPSKTVEAYDPIQNKWNANPLMTMPTARWGTASDVLGGQIYVVGGSESCPQVYVIASAALEAYDPVADNWTAMKPMSTPRWDLAAVAVNGKLYAIGGWDPVNQTALDVVEEFDPSNTASPWTTKSHMLTKRSGSAAVAMNGKIYVFGGLNEFNRLLTTVEIYDPVKDQWTTAPPIPPTTPPSITLVSPTSGTQGQTISNFTVVGSNFDSGAMLSFSGTGITPKTPYTSMTTTEIVTDLAVASNAAVGTQDVIITNSDGQKSTLAGGFTVDASGLPPTITSIFPTNGAPNQIIATFEVDGSNFDQAAVLSFDTPNIAIDSYSLHSATKIIANISIGSGVSLGGHDVFITDSNAQSSRFAAAFSVGNPGFLSFPLKNRGPYDAKINTVFDHRMTRPYCPGNGVEAFTNEVGDGPVDPNFSVAFVNCNKDKIKDPLYGYSSSTPGYIFQINGQYTGASYVYYDGHPGIDYRTIDQNPTNGQIPVLAAAAGKVVCVFTKNNACPDGPGEVKIVHPNGYATIYLHLFTPEVSRNQQVQSQQEIGISGSRGTDHPHLHFEVHKILKGGLEVPVDPYGWWQGKAADPYTPQAVNVNLWK